MKDRAKGRKTCKKGRIVAKNGQNIYNKSMKKVISVALVAILIVTTALTFTGCIFNTGAEKEVYGGVRSRPYVLQFVRRKNV